MHTNRISLARKILLGLGALLALALLSGCESVVLTNLTPASLPENPSQIYTFTLRVTPKVSTITAGSIKPHVIVDGQNYAMNKSSLADGLYEFEYQVPAGREELAYYFLVNYEVEINGTPTLREAYTDITHARIVHRYVLSLEVNRGPIGARVSVLGRGFTPQDVLYFDSTAARTVFESPNALSLFVPALEANRNYRVTLNSPAGNSPVGSFRIDPSNVSVSPASITLVTGQRLPITFNVPNSAPPGGLLLDITTDVPESVIMPEVVVPQGQNSVTVTVEGGKPGTGSLFLKGYGAGEVNVPVTVTAK
ncbi:MAG: hypothetical protein JWM35_2690 [Verrucomicrobia bacterium]|nr:hypothetical protein [Verrucomicrobiota bacterium]